MILTATGRAVTAAFVGAQSTAGDARTRTHEVAVRQKPRWRFSSPPAE
jgi:hypothetical protein